MTDPVTEGVRGTVTLADHHDDSYGQCAVCRVYVPHTDDEYLSMPFPCPTVTLARAEAGVSMTLPGSDELARTFHEQYERLAPSFGYVTRRDSSVPWEDVPEPNRSLMLAVATEVLERWPALAARSAKENDHD